MLASLLTGFGGFGFPIGLQTHACSCHWLVKLFCAMLRTSCANPNFSCQCIASNN